MTFRPWLTNIVLPLAAGFWADMAVVLPAGSSLTFGRVLVGYAANAATVVGLAALIDRAPWRHR